MAGESNEEQLNKLTSPFDAIRHLDGEREYWLARELSKILGYNRWENFEKVIAKAKVACKYNGEDVDLNFRETTKISRIGSRQAARSIRDVELSRYACYIVVQNSDSSKPIVSHAMGYFAVQTRRQELADSDTFAQLSEDEKRLIYRAQLSLYNRKLAQTAHQAGVITPDDHAQFADMGYRGLYGGLTENDIHALKLLESDEEISSWMSSEELADNIFRAAQTDAAMKRERVQGKEKANTTHFTVARKVREFIINELGGTPPEELPTPQKSIQQLEQEEQFRLKHKDQPSLFDLPPEE
ncbi:MAG TPA: DNA damage-inducible protein D [Ktedonosporobacter sp.]|nr:DNA damage-inducible protein D [Ktedonosporobacter sp.]